MTGVAKILALVKTDLDDIEKAKKILDLDDESKQKTALMDIVIYCETAAGRASRLKDKVERIRTKLVNYLTQVKADAAN